MSRLEEILKKTKANKDLIIEPLEEDYIPKSKTSEDDDKLIIEPIEDQEEQLSEDAPTETLDRAPSSIAEQASAIAQASSPELQEEVIDPEAPTEGTEQTFEERLLDAYKRADRARLTQDLLKGAEMVGRSIGGTGYDAQDLAMYDRMAERAEKIPERVKEQEKVKQLQQQRQEEKELEDPDSELSKRLRKTLGQYLGGEERLEGLSAKEIENLFPTLSNLVLQQEYAQIKRETVESSREEKEAKRKERAEREDRLLAKDQLNAARGLLKDDPRFKKAVEQGMEFESVNRLLVQAGEGNQAALAALGTKLARAMGEVGVLTDTDVVRYVGGTSWGRKLKDWASKGFQGELSQDTLEDIKENLDLLQNKLGDDVERVYDNASRRMKTAYPDLEDKTIKGLLGSPNIVPVDEEIKEAKPMEPNFSLVKSPDGKVRRIPKEMVPQALEAGGELVR